MSNSQYYLTRAAESAREAGNARLANVRERHLQSEAAWRAMASRLLHCENLRNASAERKDKLA